MKNRSWRRFAKCLPATFLIVTQLQPVLGAESARKLAQLKAPATPAATSIAPAIQPPAKLPVPANQNISPQTAANDNFRIGTGLGTLGRFNSYVLGGMAIFGGSVLGTIGYEKSTGQTGIDWSDIYDLVKSGDYNPFSINPKNIPPQTPNIQPTSAPKPTPITKPIATPEPEPQAVGKYPCEKFSANLAGKITPDTPKTEEEKKQFELANPYY